MATAALAAVMPAGSASAANYVECGDRDFASIKIDDPRPGGPRQECLANAGSLEMPDSPEFTDTWWLKEIWTGNNCVKWYGDGRWQPEGEPIKKYTKFTFPNHPGGVAIEKIGIEKASNCPD
ncbi:hypothetical protein ITI46_26370 [Streptomyces oryzae]|uniref:Secreted protein n=2 Tax=Streptomyces oryzae TaxID=1434886 RepID=A0ABS3XID6_9ACTN|nr:hypothetical protein [Streptomyces oryzae]